ncbi:hypothetical protein DMB95_08945 [Campylobacter sp. MIT 12-8780]|uniref:hypothetical protein n=1 Tax=unclassified Campylobacter TaxID=2593542 RepID=UPI00115EA0E5|nr:MULTISPECIES: hypothetical protein [unclassified Campylobacter]NDJ27921.1 hypothetical protein [Campylobacter sp. MIT 19-121]TQR40146.1 hypothetical protein DMB95_08945 [Campylobacter sp. MIT 12-8780]
MNQENRRKITKYKVAYIIYALWIAFFAGFSCFMLIPNIIALIIPPILFYNQIWFAVALFCFGWFSFTEQLFCKTKYSFTLFLIGIAVAFFWADIINRYVIDFSKDTSAMQERMYKTLSKEEKQNFTYLIGIRSDIYSEFKILLNVTQIVCHSNENSYACNKYFTNLVKNTKEKAQRDYLQKIDGE